MLESIPYSVVVIAAVALSAACVLAVLLHRFGRIVPERGAAPLLVLAVAAVLYGGTKPGSGTNAPPLLSGVFAPRGGSITAFTDAQLAAGFALAEARTNETHDFMPPPGAVVHEPWRRRGAHEDFISLPATNWSFPWGTAAVSRATVLSSGEIGFDGGYSASNRIAPFAASLGIVPEANWPLLGNGATNSLFWHAATSDSLTLTWLNALLDRDTDSSVSFQASLHRSGDFIFRYDLPAALALYNFPPSQLSQSSQLSQPASSPFAGAFANGFGEAYANGPATTLRWASLAGLANDADFDGDGISDADEVFAYHTNPRMADTDGDFIDDSFEIGLGTSPCRFDSDGDGLSDDIDPDPVVPCSSSAFGFSDEWIEATFGEEDGTAIKAMGFENYAGNLFANDTDGRIYLLEAHVDSLADDGRAEIVVGRYHVVVDSTGTYVFPLERGTYYLLSANPAAGVVFSTDDPAATISPHSMYRRGGVFNPLAALAVTPGECHFSYQWQTQAFSASRVAVASDDGDIWTWSCDNPNVRIVSPGQSQTDIQWTGPVVPWNAVEVQVRYSGTGVSRIGTNFWITVGDHVEPRANISIDAPNAVFLNDDDDDLDGTPDLEESLTANDDDDLQPITVSVSLEDPRWGAGEISIFPKNANTPGLSFWSDRKKTREVSLPVTMETDRGNGASQYTFFAEGSARQWGYGTVLVAVFMNGDGAYSRAESSRMTVLNPFGVRIIEETGNGMATLVGSNIVFELKIDPDMSMLPSGVDTQWFTGKRRSDGSYDPLEEIEAIRSQEPLRYVYEAETSGVFRVSATLSIGSSTRQVDCLRTRHSEHDPDEDEMSPYDHFGVASSPQQLALRNKALEYLGSNYAAANRPLSAGDQIPALEVGVNKCNIFVAKCIRQSDLRVPSLYSTRLAIFRRNLPPLANDWANGKPIDGWTYLGREVYPEPGFVVGHPSDSGSGHVGIVDFDGLAIGAGSRDVSRRYYQFLDGTCGYSKPSENNP